MTLQGGVQPNTKSYNKVLAACARPDGRGGSAVTATYLLSEMEELAAEAEAAGNDEAIACRPDRKSYTSLISAWARSNAPDKADRALSVLERMEENSSSSSVGGAVADGKAIGAEKRRKFERKRLRRLDEERVVREREEWVRSRSDFARLVGEDDVARLRARRSSSVENVGEEAGSRKRKKRGKRSDEDNSADDSSSRRTGAGDKNEDEGGGDDEERLDELERWLSPYMDLKEGSGTVASSAAASGDEGGRRRQRRLFIAEGTENVRVLIQRSGRKMTCIGGGDDERVRLLSILVKPSALFDEPVNLLRDVEGAATAADADISGESSGSDRKGGGEEATSTMVVARGSRPSPPFRVLVGSEAALSAVAGFRIARGALACGVAPRRDGAWLRKFLAARRRRAMEGPEKGRGGNQDAAASEGGIAGTRLLALDGVRDESNVGSAVRTAAAFGVAAVIVSDDSADAWYRRSVRVSMGHVFTVPIVRVSDLAATVAEITSGGFLADEGGVGVEAGGEAGVGVGAEDCECIPSYAAVVDTDAEMVLEQMSYGDVPPSWCCVIGNEGTGVTSAVVAACSSRIRIGMTSGVDSLSVPVATGILLHGLSTRERQLDE